jgi:hypothetical protein
MTGATGASVTSAQSGGTLLLTCRCNGLDDRRDGTPSGVAHPRVHISVTIPCDFHDSVGQR